MKVHLPEAYSTRIYPTQGGFFAIAQARDGLLDEAIVLISKEQAKIVLKHLRLALKNPEFWVDTVSRDDE